MYIAIVVTDESKKIVEHDFPLIANCLSLFQTNDILVVKLPDVSIKGACYEAYQMLSNSGYKERYRSPYFVTSTGFVQVFPKPVEPKYQVTYNDTGESQFGTPSEPLKKILDELYEYSQKCCVMLNQHESTWRRTQ